MKFLEIASYREIPMSFAERISGFNRKRKFELFLRKFQPTESCTILDVGYRSKELSVYDNYLERHYPHPHRIIALGIEESAEFHERYPSVETVVYDGRIFPFQDKQFDICWSNAVMEHVGNRERQLLFLREIKRVSKRAYVTTPNLYFPIEVHTRVPLLHFLLPKSMFDALLKRIGEECATSDHLHLLGLSDVKSLLVEAGITDYELVKNRFFGFTMDFSIIMRF